MADHLPDDLRQWPDDPFRLLGVVPPVTEQDLKRAYTRLIRRFKPEHHPEEFRRVREAYEAALQRAKWFGFFATPEPASSDKTDSKPVPTVAPESKRVVEPAEASPRQPAIIDPVEEAWASGVAGQQTEAYSRLVELAAARPESADPALRLYWLLALKPSLDSNRTRHDWLFAALIRSRLGGPASELYTRELSTSPETALFGPYTRLLEVPGAAPGVLLRLARERLTAAAGSRSWARLDGDLCALFDRHTELDEPAWLAYLVNVMGYAALDEPAPLYERCTNLVQCLRHLELSQSWAFDQMDEHKARGKLWRRGSAVPGPLREMIRVAWVGPYSAWRSALTAAAAWAADDPPHTMYELDQAAGIRDAHPLLATLDRALDEHHQPAGPEYPPGLIRGLVGVFLTDAARKDYTFLRPGLIRFLVKEVIDPEALVRACAVDAQYMTRSLVEHVRNDSVLRLVWRIATASPG